MSATLWQVHNKTSRRREVQRGTLHHRNVGFSSSNVKNHDVVTPYGVTDRNYGHKIKM